MPPCCRALWSDWEKVIWVLALCFRSRCSLSPVCRLWGPRRHNLQRSPESLRDLDPAPTDFFFLNTVIQHQAFSRIPGTGQWGSVTVSTSLRQRGVEGELCLLCTIWWTRTAAVNFGLECLFQGSPPEIFCGTVEMWTPWGDSPSCPLEIDLSWCWLHWVIRPAQ